MTGPDIPSGCLDGKVHRFAVRVYYEDTDLSGVVYHANYLRWFERARSDLLRLIGIDQRRAHEAGEGAFAVADMALRYASPARLDDGVVVETRLAALNGASCTLLQQAFRQEILLCAARVRVAFVTPGGRPRRLPRAWHDAFAALIDSAQDLEKAP
ncbi:tol-pal system-associated acyl-CoA thioesterase [Novosphingobium pokkalii]|uniref:Tol-pal system-associated acyl-CoA thioesterase n=1 Tax=Novosphingobium pokkalii TaxID=1770194 RepID=A0ABV7V5N3_9SPHN|nr:tol-pal system-associated acyl-CoA thioesterase [Novosphingobium pokkalii]GHC92839.1 tol-pal system-associated acyl-CoA thioesterase [Novosphingobium pokkalii]